MDEYLQYMRNLRSQMNDVEDQAAMTSVEEQTLITTIQTLEKDIQSEKAEAKKLEVDIELMVKAKGNICTQIIERQRKIAALESDSSTLAQTLELLHQENTATTTKLAEKRSYYDAISKDIAAKFQDQKEWIDTHCHGFQGNTDSPIQLTEQARATETELSLSINKVQTESLDELDRGKYRRSLSLQLISN